MEAVEKKIYDVVRSRLLRGDCAFRQLLQINVYECYIFLIIFGLWAFKEKS